MSRSLNHGQDSEYLRRTVSQVLGQELLDEVQRSLGGVFEIIKGMELPLERYIDVGDVIGIERFCQLRRLTHWNNGVSEEWKTR